VYSVCRQSISDSWLGKTAEIVGVEHHLLNLARITWRNPKFARPLKKPLRVSAVPDG
jgi:hypothetical protein